MYHEPLIIVNFDGVVGTTVLSSKSTSSQIDNIGRAEAYYKEVQEDEVIFRQGAAKNLKYLMGSFQLVLFMNKYRKKQDAVISIIENKIGDVFDAVYTRCSYKNENKVTDYSQIYDDFGIRHDEIEDKVMIL